jgi:hypothetical protein
MRYSEISKEMLSLYFGLDVFCQFEDRFLEFNAVFIVQCIVYGGEGRLHVKFWDSSPKLALYS